MNLTLVFYKTRSLLRSERFAWYIKAANGQKLARAEGFTHRMACEHNADIVTRFPTRSEITVERRW